MKILLRCIAPSTAAAIWILSSQSRLPVIKGVFGIDKVQHILAYAVLAVGVAFWFSRARWKVHAAQTLVVAACIASLYGVTDEVHQHFVPGRDCNVWDWAADTIGALLGAALYWRVLKFKELGWPFKGLTNKN
ncbi:MAG: VanZ family protein [Prevotellaceae bacterium]|nr:VanZ family protein [Prevotellaceae bacterium]